MQLPILYVYFTETHLKFSAIGSLPIFQVRGYGLTYLSCSQLYQYPETKHQQKAMTTMQSGHILQALQFLLCWYWGNLLFAEEALQKPTSFHLCLSRGFLPSIQGISTIEEHILLLPHWRGVARWVKCKVFSHFLSKEISLFNLSFACKK